jgi:hypothetical protein
MNRDIIFTLKEYKNRYTELLTNYLLEYEDYEYIDFVTNEICRYNRFICEIEYEVIHYSDDGGTWILGDGFSHSDKRLVEKVTDIFGDVDSNIIELLRFSFIKILAFLELEKNNILNTNELKRVQEQQFGSAQPKETINETEQKLPYKITLLNELGFFKLDAIKKLTKENQFKIISSLTGGTHRTVKGNVNVLDPNSNEDRIKYTSNNYTDEVKMYLDKLK